ncbi:MAG TPA: ABC transporter substrate-binding protein [Thermoleophilia bacterium]|nr:ABC transporter substrate-binding protein [Thermoleophilia bacterium]
MSTTRPGWRPAATTRRRPAAGILLAAIALAALAAIGLAACGSSTSSSASPSASAAGPITVTDSAGNTVTLQQPATRIVSLAPANTEIAYAVGAGSKMVAGTSYDDYPAAAKSLPKAGDFSNPSVEKIASFNPDLVLITGGVQAHLRAKLVKLGMNVYVIDPTTYAGVMTDIANVGKLAGTSAEAQKVVDTMKQAEADVQAKVGSLTKKSTFIEIYSKPLMTAGTGTFISDMVGMVGGTNLGDSAGAGFPNFSSEVLLKDDPAVYIADSGSMSKPGDLSTRPGFSSLTAVKDGHVYVIQDDLIARPGPRLALGLQQLARMIHPEAYTTP